MNPSNGALALLVAGLSCLPLHSRPMIDPDRPVLVSMQAALDVDRDGRVTAVTFVDDAKLPDAIRERGEEVAKSWTFVPPHKSR